MSLTIPRTDVLSVGFSNQKFQLMERQELSRTANGRAIGKSLGSALWRVEYATINLPHDEALDYEAIVNSLDGVINAFYAYDLRRPFPKAHADGDFSESGVAIYAVGLDGKSLRLDGLPAGFILSRGDYLAFDYGSAPSRALHQVMETVTADGSGISPSFEVRPHLRAGVAVDDEVMLKQPSALFTLEPGSVTPGMSDGQMNTVSFSAVQML